MSLKTARHSVSESAKKLLQAGLVARTWGNVSCRVDKSHFAITPSGRSYQAMRPEEIVIANIYNDDYWGTLLPSSETAIHREIYCRRPEVNFIIHTHQFEASVFSALDRNLSVRGEGIFGGEIPCARYGFPGSDQLRHNVTVALDSTVGPAVLLAHHGVIIMGQGEEDTFRLALVLEVAAFRRINEALSKQSGKTVTSREGLYEYLLEDAGYQETLPRHQFPDSVRQGDGFEILAEDNARRYALTDTNLPPIENILQKIYRARPDINAIVQGLGGACLTFSVLGETLPTYLDDCAQIGGISINRARFEETDILDALADNHAVFVAESGLLCCGETLDDANAIALVVEKNARVHFVGPLFGGTHSLEQADTEKLRTYYLEWYAKRF